MILPYTILFIAHLTFQSAWALNLVADYSGSTFFNNWNFYGKYDNLTSGDVIWVDRKNATADHLAYVNDAGNAVIKVDNTTFVPYNIKRNSVRIETQQAFSMESIIIADFVHMPYGCSVWPAFWTKGVNWPSGGEIDIVEGVNLMSANQMALHTRAGCTLSAPAAGTQTGQSGGLNCTLDAGCTVTETKTNSFGQDFDQAGGGVFATHFDSSGIYIWFWSRANIPASVTSASTSKSPLGLGSLSDWGTPSASYPTSSSCSISQYFDPQTLVLDITLCGIWAGVSSVYLPQCASQGTTQLCYNDNVINAGSSGYANAYFEIRYVRVYGTATPSTSGASPSNSQKSTVALANAMIWACLALIWFGV
jgi:hypothetical protein